MDYVAAYTVGNDISSRKLQIDRALAGPVPQWGFSKGFDTFAPIGPCLVRANVIGDPSRLRLETLIDGELRQDVLISDLVFGCAALVSYLSTGTTLQKGSVIMTGTPGGGLSLPFTQVSIANNKRCRKWPEASPIFAARYSDGSQGDRYWNAKEWSEV